MALRTSSSDSSRPVHLAVSAPAPPPISKDLQSSDNSIPLSPQWLLPKPGENKPGVGSGENQSSPYNFGRSDSLKSPGNSGDVHDAVKKKDVFRPSLLDMETGIRDRWREEERDTKSSTRKDLWREGDNDASEARNVDRWTDNPSNRHFGEARRGASERWTDTGNRENNYEARRESKWNSRWGPDDKEKEVQREKWTDSVKDGDMPLEKGLSHHNSRQVKDEKDGDHYRPWRPSFVQNRGRGDPSHHPNLTLSKQGSAIPYGRGRGEISSTTFSHGRGRGNSGFSPPNRSFHSQSSGVFTDKGESVPGGPSPLRYSRTKLLDIYRKATRSSWKVLDGFVQVPSLTQDENTEPLALFEPTLDELVILKGIEKGDITSSGAPQVSKDGSAGRGSADSTPLRKPFGSKEDLHPAGYGSIDISRGGFSEGSFHEKQMQQLVSNVKTEIVQDQLKYHDDKFSGEAIYDDNAPYQKAAEVSTNRASGIQGEASTHVGTPWRSPSMAERARTSSQEWRGNPVESKSSNVDPGWSQSRKDPSGNWDEGFTNSSYPRNDQGWQASGDALGERQSIGFVHREPEARNLPSAPEDLVLCYKDPQGNVQGPFSGSDIIGWFEAGYFGIDLQVRLASASNDSPFSLLGDVMPHLRAKARPPPGFNSPKPTEASDLSSMSGSSSFGMHHSGPTDIGILKNDSRSTNGPSTDAENRFLESLMSGTQAYPVNNLTGAPGGVESGNNIYNLLAKKMALERQRSIPDPYSYWSGREVAPVVPKPGIVPDVASVHSNLLSSMADNSRLPQSQNADLMSVLQNLSDRPTGVNNGIGGWSNVPGGLGTLQDSQNFPLQAALGIQQQRLQQNQPALPNLLAHNIDNPGSIITPDRLLSIGLSQDPQVLNMLQQQYLMQLQSQGPVPTPQLSLLDKLMLLKQQQKQEEQQQLLRQQQLLSQVLTDHQSPQLFGETSFGLLKTQTIPAEPPSFEHPRVQQSRELFQTGSNVPVANNDVDHTTNFQFLPHQISKDSGIGTETASLHLPHQIFGSVTGENHWGNIVQEQPSESQQKEKSVLSGIRVSQSSLKVMESISSDPPLLHTSVPINEIHFSQNLDQELKSTLRIQESLNSVASELPSATMDSKLVEVQSDDGAVEEQKVENDQFNEDSAMMEMKNVEAREAKKGSEKKSRRQRSSKSAENAKGVPKASAQQQRKQIETGEGKLEDSKGPEEPPTSPGNRRGANAVSEAVDCQGDLDVKDEWKMGGPVSSQDTQGQALQRAWKPAPGFKPKSLLEIQQEEQRRLLEERSVSAIPMSVNTMVSSAAWSGIVANADSKTSRVSHQDKQIAESSFDLSEKSQAAKSKTSQLHDLLAEEALSKYNDREMEVSDLHITSQMEPVNAALLEDNDKFIEAKDTKKNRKKSGKSKGSSKISTPVSEVSFGTNTVEKGTSRQAQQENEVLPAVPSGPSLGDFVPWKGEPANPSPLPAWSTGTGKQSKTTTSLRDILKEQQKKVFSLPNPIPTPVPQRSQSSQASRGSGPSWSSQASPSKLASPVQINSHASTQSKYSEDDDLFWGPVDQTSKQVKQSDFPQLGNQGNWGNKSAPGKVTPVGLSRQKSVGGRAAEFSLSSSPVTAQSSMKGKRDSNKQLEAMDFRDWCENESVRLTGTRDTSFLEYCLKQSRSEAEILLVENLGLYDPDHEFIDKFLNYKELLSTEVLDIAFQTQNDWKTTGFNIRDATPAGAGASDIDRDYATVQEGSAKGNGGKKRGKKGKKVSPSVLGFNVVSNRIMMGEIQTVED